MEALELFYKEKKERLARQRKNAVIKKACNSFLSESLCCDYSYNFSWLGRPIIQYPQDLVALQEIIWRIKPDLIIETGIAHGGSVIFSASMLELLGGKGRVLGIDVDIRSHNRPLIEGHPLAHRLEMIEASSTSPEAFKKAKSLADDSETIMLILDSNHTHNHVLEEMRLYGPLVSIGSYMVVFDGIIEKFPEASKQQRPWGPGNNPFTAIQAYLAENNNFEVDEEIENKLLITAAPSGYLRKRA